MAKAHLIAIQLLQVSEVLDGVGSYGGGSFYLNGVQNVSLLDNQVYLVFL